MSYSDEELAAVPDIVFKTEEFSGQTVIQPKSLKRKRASSPKEYEQGTFFTCELCCEEFSGVPSLEAHSRDAHDNFAYACDQCREIFNTTESLMCHIRLFVVFFSCVKCRFFSVADLYCGIHVLRSISPLYFTHCVDFKNLILE